MNIQLRLELALPLLVTGLGILYACGSQPATPTIGNDGGSSGSSGGSSGSGSGATGSGGNSGGQSSNGSSGSSGSGSGSSTGSSSGSSGSTGSSSGGTSSSSSSSSGSSSGGSSGAASSGGSVDAGVSAPVLQHHTNASRDGVYTSPTLTKAVAGTVKRDAGFAPTINGAVYAQPLYVPNGPNGSEAFYVATESNHVTAVGGTGTVLWDKTYGNPAMTLPCGNILPLGITGTPIIDLPSRTMFFDAMTDMGSGSLAHLIHAVSIDDGTEKTGWPVNVNTAVSGFDSSHQNERGALALVGGVLYVPYGGHLGDCGAYHGYVVGVSITSPSTVLSWTNNGIGMMPAFKGGIWAAGGISSDGTSVYVSTGNTSTSGASAGGSLFSAPSIWSGGEALFRLASGPKFSNQTMDYFYPSSWADMDNSDADLGGANPIPFDLGTNHYLAAPGKDGNLYLVNRDNLGGMGAQISSTSVSSGNIIGAPALYKTNTATYLAFRGMTKGCPSGQTGGNLGVVKIPATGAPTVAWCSNLTLGSPMVTTTGNGDAIVWDASNKLYAFDGDTGAQIFAGGAASDQMAATMQYMNTPMVAGTRIAVATSGHLYLFHP